MRQLRRRYNRGKILGGLLLLTAGALFMAREMGAMVPHWVFTWKMLLIALGFVAGAKRAFAPGGWMIVVLVGAGFLLADLYPTIVSTAYLLPALLIAAGLIVLFRPFRPRDHYWRQWHDRCEAKKKEWQGAERFDNDDFIDSTTVFGGVRKHVFSKNFRGGDVTNVFGGTEINLSQADFKDGANLEITQVLGGTRLVVPPHWKIKSSLTAVLGNVDDKRTPVPAGPGEAKVLHLTGTSILGGIEIRSM